MGKKRHKKRYPGIYKRHGPIRDGRVHSSKPPVIIKSSPRRYEDNAIGKPVSGGRMGNRPVENGNGYISGRYEGTDQFASSILVSDDNCETFRELAYQECNFEFNIPYGKPEKMKYEPWGIIYDADGKILYQGYAEYVTGYANGIMAIIRALERDSAGPWTRKAFIMNRHDNGEYFYKGETHKKVIYEDGSSRWQKVLLAKGDVVVRPGSRGWAVEGFQTLTKIERDRPVIAGKEGKIAEKAQSNAYGSGLDFEDKRLMSGYFAARFDG